MRDIENVEARRELGEQKIIWIRYRVCGLLLLHLYLLIF